MTTERSSERQPRERRPGALERGHVRFRLIRDLADGAKTQRQLARDYGVSSSSITEFKQRHAADIATARQDLDNEFAALWIANKANRLAEYQAQADEIGDGRVEVLLGETGDGEPVTGEKLDAALLRAKQAALRAVAEEMGSIPSKVNISVEPVTVRYEVVGVDPEALT